MPVRKRKLNVYYPADPEEDSDSESTASEIASPDTIRSTVIHRTSRRYRQRESNIVGTFPVDDEAEDDDNVSGTAEPVEAIEGVITDDPSMDVDIDVEMAEMHDDVEVLCEPEKSVVSATVRYFTAGLTVFGMLLLLER